MRTVMASLAAVLLVSACSGGGAVTPTVLDTFAYSEGGNQRVACCTGREEQLRTGESVEYPLVGVPWWADGTWHDAESGPVSCIKPDRRTPVRIGYVETEVSDDAPGTTVIAWVRCER